MKKALVSVDSGKHSSKGIMEYGGKQYISMFRTKVQKVQQVGIDVPKNSFLVEYEGDEYLIGDIVSEEYSDYSLSKQIINHKLAIYAALIDLESKAGIDFRNVELHLAINAPINVYKDSKAKEEYHNFIFNDGKPIRLTVNKKSYVFSITNLIVAFEGMGVIFSEAKEYTNKNSTVIDIGGLNATYCDFTGLNPDFNSMVVNNYGTSALKSKLEQSIIERFGVTVSNNDLENILLDGMLVHQGVIIEGSADLISGIKKSHLELIINYAKRQGYTFNNRKIVFVGGGSVLLSEQIRSLFPLAEISVNPQFANLKSFLAILKVKNEK